jgi:hypothetical protein
MHNNQMSGEIKSCIETFQQQWYIFFFSKVVARFQNNTIDLYDVCTYSKSLIPFLEKMTMYVYVYAYS